MRSFNSLANPSYEAIPLTDFESVGPQTELESLNLNWRERDLPERQRTKHVHRLHPYLGKYIPQIVEVFLRKFRPSRVYDPFSGCGTTLIEANVLGIESIGCDVSQFNCLVARCKVAHYDLKRVERELRDALCRLGMQSAPGLFSQNDAIANDNSYLREWFHPDALRTLLLYRDLMSEYEHRDLMSVILSRSARSARLTPHHNLDFPKKPQREAYQCRKHDRLCRPTSDAYQFLSRYTLDTIERLKEFASIQTNARAEVRWEDSRCTNLPTFDMMMTSPPYVGLIDYHEQHRYAYELLGLPRQDEKEIGAAFKGKSAKAHEDYLDDVKHVMSNARRYLAEDGVAVIVVGDRENLYTDEVARELDFQAEERLMRHVNRRTGRRNSDFFESVLVWRPA